MSFYSRSCRLNSLNQFEKENFKSNTAIDPYIWNFVCLEVKEGEFKVYINNKLNIVFALSHTLRHIESPFVNKRGTEVEIDQNGQNQKRDDTINLSLSRKFDFSDVFVLGETNMNFNKYYNENLLIYNRDKLSKIRPFLSYYNLQCMKNELHVKNGTQESHLDKLLEFKLQKELNNRTVNHERDYTGMKAYIKQLVSDVKNVQNVLYPVTMDIADRKIIVKEIKDIFTKYIFIHKCLTLISPPVKEETQNIQFNFIKCNKILRHEKFRQHYPIYPITFKTFARFLKRTFGLKHESIAFIKQILIQTPYFWPKITAYKETENDVVQYDKALYFLAEVFLNPHYLDVISETLIITNSYERLGIDADSEVNINLINYLICSTPFNNNSQRNYRLLPAAPIDAYNYDLNSFIERQSVLKTSMVKFSVKSIDEGTKSKIIILDSDGGLNEYIFDMKVNKECDINIKDQPILKITAKVDNMENALETLIIYTTEDEIIFKGDLPNKTNHTIRTIEPEYLIKNLFFFTRVDKLNGIFFVLNDEEPVQDFDVLRQQCIIPSDFELKSLLELKLRFDMTYFSKTQLEKYKNSISLLKYDVNAYTRNVNYVIDFLESVFPNCSTICNAIEPLYIGEFRVFVMGVSDTPKNISKQEIKTLDQIIKSNRYDLFKNNSEKRFPEVEELYFNICELILQHSEVSLFVERHLSFLTENGIFIEDSSRTRIEEEIIDAKDQSTSIRNRKLPEAVKCVNYTCGKQFERSNNEICTGHTGSWDFGHTGITIEDTLKEYNKEKSSKVLWKPHWSCCGRKWEEACSAIHKHVSSDMDPSKKFEIDTNTRECQKWFKKRIRKTWLNQIKNFHKFSDKQVSERIRMFAGRRSIKMTAIPLDLLAALCDTLNMHLLVISDDMSYHFKLLDLINKKAFKFIDDGTGNIDIDKFVKWWFADLKQVDALY